jgi:membrane protease YdiL (CAAX protease family)
LVGTPWKEVVYGTLIFGVGFSASWGALITGLEWFGYGEPPADPGDPTYLLPVSIFLGAAAEEVVFRCYLWVRLVDLTRRPALSLVLSSLLFSVVHGYDAALSLRVFVSGCVWGLFYWATGRLPRLVVAHWTENIARVYWL